MIFTIAQYALAITAIATAVGLAVKWVVVAPIKAYIDLKTYPIQPTSNGGKSLPDVLTALESLHTEVRHIKGRIELIERNTPPF